MQEGDGEAGEGEGEGEGEGDIEKEDKEEEAGMAAGAKRGAKAGNKGADYYDMDDDFIDDAEVHDFYAGDRRKTKYRGFFMNKARARGRAAETHDTRACMLGEACRACCQIA